MLQKISDQKDKSYLDIGDRRYTNTRTDGQTSYAQENQIVLIRKARFSRGLEQIVSGPHYGFPLKQTVRHHTLSCMLIFICMANFVR
jgi:hypothetical protein